MSIIVQSPKFTRTILLKPMHNTSTTYIQQYLSSKDLDICQTNNRSGQSQMSFNVKQGSFLSTDVENNKVAFSSIHDQQSDTSYLAYLILQQYKYLKSALTVRFIQKMSSIHQHFLHSTSNIQIQHSKARDFTSKRSKIFLSHKSNSSNLTLQKRFWWKGTDGTESCSKNSITLLEVNIQDSCYM